MQFEKFVKMMQENFNEMIKDETCLFQTEIDKDKIWDIYLESFPDGTNPIFRERRVHDCVACKQFIRRFGGVVAIKDGKVRTIWDFQTGDTTYQPVIDALNNYVKSKIQDRGQYYILLDEIQLVPNFESVVNGFLHIGNVDIYVTGSNSRFLSSDIITEFRGRGDEIRIRPLSFSEIRPLYDSDDAAWDDYFNYGGLPSIYAERMDDEQKISFLEYVTRTIYIKDIVERNKLKDDKGISSVLDLLSSATGSLTNPLKLSNTFKSRGQKGITDKTISN